MQAQDLPSPGEERQAERGGEKKREEERRGEKKREEEKGEEEGILALHSLVPNHLPSQLPPAAPTSAPAQSALLGGSRGEL